MAGLHQEKVKGIRRQNQSPASRNQQNQSTTTTLKGKPTLVARYRPLPPLACIYDVWASAALSVKMEKNYGTDISTLIRMIENGEL